MKTIKILLLPIIILLVFVSMELVFAQEQPISVFEIEDKSETIVLENGDARVKETISMSIAAFTSFEQRYPILSSFTRLFKPMNMPIQIEDLEIDKDDAKNQIVVEYLLKGIAVNMGDHWEIDVLQTASGQEIDLVAQNDNVLVFTVIGEVTQGVKMVTTITLKLPKKAKNINFDSETDKISYELSGKLIGKNFIFLILAGVFVAVGISSYFILKSKPSSILQDKQEDVVPESETKG